MTSDPRTSNAGGLLQMWWGKRHLPVDPETSFAGRTVLITGGNAGLGLEAAIKFAKLGAAGIIIGVRSLARGEQAKTEICQKTGYDSKKIRLYVIDMSTFESVKHFAKEVAEKEPRIDITILNAGITAPSHKLSSDGYEMTLQVNLLSTTLLAILLLPQLEKAAQISGQSSYLEFVGSLGHRTPKENTFDSAGSSKILDYVNSEPFFNYLMHYQVSKLLLMYVMEGLVQHTSARPHEDSKSNLIISTCCPGLCRTNLGRDFSSLIKTLNGLFQLVFARTAEEGSRTIVSSVTLGKESHGEIWSHDALVKKGELVISEKGKTIQRQVWAEILEVLQPHIPQDSSFHA